MQAHRGQWEGGWSIAFALPYRNISSNMALNSSKGVKSRQSIFAVGMLGETRGSLCGLQRGAAGRRPEEEVEVIYEASLDKRQ